MLRLLGVHGNELEILRRREDVPAFEVQHEAPNIVVPVRNLRHQAQRLRSVVFGQVAPAGERAPDLTTAIWIQARDSCLHGIEDAAARTNAAVANEGDLLPAVASASAALRGERAVLATLQNEQPLSVVLVPSHRKCWLGWVAVCLLPISGVVEEELDLPIPCGHLRVHEELLGVGEEPVLESILRSLDPETPQLAGARQRLHEVGDRLAGQALLNDVRELEATLMVPLVVVDDLVITAQFTLGALEGPTQLAEPIHLVLILEHHGCATRAHKPLPNNA
mmetsp:Transcript_59167/g.183714  ORF Transcript_59167/g.183714 Transcript_59167/m.183714 type:complete len:279 (+) Transcript_59167:307-1143(+)